MSKPKKKAAKKPGKKRAEAYEPKLKVKGSFIDVINAAVTPNNTLNKSPKP